MKRMGLEEYPQKVLGHVPGIDIGDEFTCRAAMMIAGLHKQLQGGIDTVPIGGNNGIRVAVSELLIILYATSFAKRL